MISPRNVLVKQYKPSLSTLYLSSDLLCLHHNHPTVTFVQFCTENLMSRKHRKSKPKHQSSRWHSLDDSDTENWQDRQKCVFKNQAVIIHMETDFSGGLQWGSSVNRSKCFVVKKIIEYTLGFLYSFTHCSSQSQNLIESLKFRFLSFVWGSPILQENVQIEHLSKCPKQCKNKGKKVLPSCKKGIYSYLKHVVAVVGDWKSLDNIK